MSNYASYVSLAVQPFSFNTNHRYKDISKHYTTLTSASNCRFIKSNIIALPLSFELVKSCNYGYFQTNSDNNTRKYYFFISDVEYINDSTTNIYITEDYFSTYADDVFNTLSMSYVQRMHSIDDTYPRTIENVAILPAIDSFIDSKSLTWGNDVIVATNRYVPQNTDISGEWIENYQVIFDSVGFGKHSGDITYRYIKTTVDKAETMVRNAIAWGYGDAIMGIYNVPVEFIQASAESDITVNFKNIRKISDTGELVESTSIPSENWKFLNYTNGMVPLFSTTATIDKNYIQSVYNAKYKKCYDSQYICAIVKLVNNSCLYDYMLFENSILFNIYCTLNENATLYIVPYNFDGVTGDNWDCDIIECGLVGNTTIAVDNSAQAFNNAIKDFSNKTLSQIFNCLSSILPNITNKEEDNENTLQIDNIVSTLSNNALNSINSYYSTRKSSTISKSNGNTKIYQYPDTSIHLGFRHLQLEDFKRLDNYFNMYGYLYNTIMMPSIRDNYSYIQGDINFTAPIPHIAYSYIKALFTSGLTIWGDSTSMFNYDVI